MSATGNVKESFIEYYFCLRVSAVHGHQEKIQYVNKRGCSDRLTGIRSKLYIVELKRPNGGKVSKQQEEDAKHWKAAGVEKVYLKNEAEIDAWIDEVTRSEY